jgi:hypothetical protein
MEGGEGVAADFETYEDYLDSQITDTDLYYLEDEDLARQLVVRARTPGRARGVHGKGAGLRAGGRRSLGHVRGATQCAAGRALRQGRLRHARQCRRH